eukprot:3888696-Lingulodinium_polyedra.AAC.1
MGSNLPIRHTKRTLALPPYGDPYRRGRANHARNANRLRSEPKRGGNIASRRTARQLAPGHRRRERR